MGIEVTAVGTIRIGFENGYTVSIGISNHHYCSRHGGSANTCEVAVLKGEKFCAIQPYDDVMGYVTPEQLAALLKIVSQKNFKPSRYVYKRLPNNQDLNRD